MGLSPAWRPIPSALMLPAVVSFLRCSSAKFHKSTAGDGTRIWHLPSSTLLCSPTGSGERGLTTAIAWIIRPDDTDDGLAFGTEDGYLCIWKRSRKEDEVS